MYRVKEVAKMVGITIRTLHHYDEIGLFRPEQVSPAGYRYYSAADLEKLQQVLFYRELGFPLAEIKEMLDSSSFDRKFALQNHRQLLVRKKERLEQLIATVDKTLRSMKGETLMKSEEMFDGFDMTVIEEHKRKYAEEARRKYGGKMMDEVEKRTGAYTPGDWERLTLETERLYQRVIAAMDRGPADPEVQEAVRELREQITSNFYDCTPEIFRGLGDLYVQDERFTRNIDRHKTGLAAFLREAMHIYCDRL
ncbi:MerR family transcriptional regulator [Paenibacillus sp. CAA11]|uniref:MerR family transcriptional regulator n=1 Tax=Paenibacillus sp. CAA11 TaxID=1532905 RepID=UPI000D3D5BD1|nr:MerR family transcriptional regulator [Paenibacillus sp. CAA11]AWB46025.1 MerR family transcriptional regulator [Paenibacillus sp. CAA11]